MRPPKYRHYKPKGLAVVRINGVDHYLGKWKSPESWEKYHRLVAAAGLAAPTPETGSATVEDVVLAFMHAHRDHYRRADGTATGELRNFKDSLQPLLNLYGETLAREFSPKGLKAVRQSMIDSGLARGTINQRIGRIIHVFKWAVSEELVPPSVYQGLKTVSGLQKGRSPARETEPIEPVADDVVDATLPHVCRQVRAMIQLQRMTGMRPGEVVIMRTADIDRSSDVWIYTPHDHKNKHRDKPRPVPIGPRARSTLELWLKADPTAYLFSPGEARKERFAAMRARRRSEVQPSQRNRARAGKRRPGLRYTTKSYGNAVRKGCALAFPHPTISGIKSKDRTPEQVAELKVWNQDHSWHPNQLRHSMGTQLRREFDLDTARAVLGHSNSDTTEIYAERDRTVAMRAIEQVG
jgi:integrase